MAWCSVKKALGLLYFYLYDDDDDSTRPSSTIGSECNKKEAENKLKYKNLSIKVQGM
jgi:hypothetical protein